MTEVILKCATLRAMSGTACDKMRLGVADMLLGRTVVRTKELTFPGDGCKIISQPGASSGGRRRPLLRAVSCAFFLLPAPLFPPGPENASSSLSSCSPAGDLCSTVPVFQRPLLLLESVVQYPDSDWCRPERDIFMLNASSLCSISCRYLDNEKGLRSAQVVSVGRVPPKLTCSTTPSSFTAVSVEAL